MIPFMLLTSLPFIAAGPMARPASPRLPWTRADSQCAVLPSGHDSTTLVVNAIIQSKDPKVTLPAAYADTIVKRIAAQFQAPPVTAFSVVSSGSIPTDTSAAAPPLLSGSEPTLDTYLYFYVRRDGTISDPLGIGMSLNHTWENAILNALSDVADQKQIPPLPKEIDQDSVLLMLAVFGAPAPRKVVKLTGVISIPRSSSPSTQPAVQKAVPIQLISLKIPRFPDHTEPKLRANATMPDYPEEARKNGVEDIVFANFVVDPNGVPVTSTIDISDAHYQEFITAVVQDIPKLRYTPAIMAGCAVHAYTSLAFPFKIQSH